MAVKSEFLSNNPSLSWNDADLKKIQFPIKLKSIKAALVLNLPLKDVIFTS